jgi:hypothetical protein
LNTPVDLNVTNTLATYRVNANVTGNPNNLAVFIWVNGTSHASNGSLLLNDVQLESGAIATPFERKTFQEQLSDCQRYYYRVTSRSSFPFAWFAFGFASTTFGANFIMPLPVTMRIPPTSVEFSTLRLTDLQSAFSVLSLTLSTDRNNQFQTSFSVGSSGMTQFRPLTLEASNSASAFLAVSAEL